jgi:hypothetical protein
VLIAPNLYKVLLWSGVGIAVVAVFVMGVFADIEAGRKRLPTAVIAKKKSRARALLRWLPAPALLLGLGFSVFVWFSTDVVIVTEDADGPLACGGSGSAAGFRIARTARFLAIRPGSSITPSVR